MCGRFTNRATAADIGGYFDVDETVTEELGPRYNIAPTDEVYLVAESARTGTRRLGSARWGLVPSWSANAAGGAKMINARAETLVDRPAFRTVFERRRGIVPADGFYEWQKRPRQAWHIRRADGGLLAFAALWDVWRPADDPEARLLSCTIVTTRPNEKVARLHDRMPVVLPRACWDAWLDPANRDVGALSGLLVPAPAADFELVPVGPAVGKVGNDGPELLAPVEPAEPVEA